MSNLPANLVSSKGKVYFSMTKSGCGLKSIIFSESKKKKAEEDNSKDEPLLLLNSFYIKDRYIFPDSEVYHHAEAHLRLHLKFIVKVHPLELLLCVCSDCLPVVRNAFFITSTTALSDQKLHLLKTHRKESPPMYS